MSGGYRRPYAADFSSTRKPIFFFFDSGGAMSHHFRLLAGRLMP